MNTKEIKDTWNLCSSNHARGQLISEKSELQLKVRNTESTSQQISRNRANSADDQRRIGKVDSTSQIKKSEILIAPLDYMFTARHKTDSAIIWSVLHILSRTEDLIIWMRGGGWILKSKYYAHHIIEDKAHPASRGEDL